MAVSAQELNRRAAAALVVGLIIAILGAVFVSLEHRGREAPPADGQEPPANDPLGGYSKDELPKESIQNGRFLWPAAYDLNNIRRQMPWTWSTCGLANTSDEIRGTSSQGLSSRSLPQFTTAQLRGQFPYYLMFFGGVWDGRPERNGWKEAAGGCGASLLTGRWGLSAAHCCEKPEKPWDKPRWVAAGLKYFDELFEPIGRGSWRKVIKNIRHPKYGHASDGSLIYDICLLHLEGPAYRFTKTAEGIILINSICVTLPMTIPYGSDHTFVGYGGAPMAHPRWFNIKYGTSWSIFEGFRLFCHGDVVKQRANRLTFCRWDINRDGDTCFGDSGGPMAARLNPYDPRRSYQTGLSSTINRSRRPPGADFHCKYITVFGLERVDTSWTWINSVVTPSNADSDD